MQRNREGVEWNIFQKTSTWYSKKSIKLRVIHFACVIDDLKIPPSNHLEALTGDRQGQHSIRINDQYRICFRWLDNHSFDVEIVDYHD